MLHTCPWLDGALGPLLGPLSVLGPLLGRVNRSLLSPSPPEPQAQQGTDGV